MAYSGTAYRAENTAARPQSRSRRPTWRREMFAMFALSTQGEVLVSGPKRQNPGVLAQFYDTQLLPHRFQHLELGEVEVERRHGDALVVDSVQVGALGRVGADALEADPEKGIAARIDAALEVCGLHVALALGAEVDAFHLGRIGVGEVHVL